MAAQYEDWTTTALLASIKRRGMLPSTTATLADSDFLAIATEEMRSYVMPALLSVNEEYGVVTEQVAFSSGQNIVDLPARATAETLRLARMSDGNGGWISLARIEPEHQADVNFWGSGTPLGYMLQDDSFILGPIPAQAVTVEISFFRRPSKLVTTSECAVISSIDPTGTTITTTASVPSTFVNGATFDIINNTPGFRAALDDVTVVTASGTTMTFSSGAFFQQGIGAGPYVCLAGQSPVPQIPVEAHALLAQRTAAKCLEALGSPSDVWKRAYEVAEEMKKDLVTMIQPRTVGSVRYLINRNGPGFSGLRRGFGWRMP